MQRQDETTSTRPRRKSSNKHDVGEDRGQCDSPQPVGAAAMPATKHPYCSGPCPFAAPLPEQPKNLDLRFIHDLPVRLEGAGVSVGSVAAAYSVSPRTLDRVFRRAVGLPPHVCIKCLGLSRAWDLLAKGYNVNQTADLVGYSSPAHFSAQFKEAFGMRPSTLYRSTRKSAGGASCRVSAENCRISAENEASVSERLGLR
jgi:AraC-like DNA-binding protein